MGWAASCLRHPQLGSCVGCGCGCGCGCGRRCSRARRDCLPCAAPLKLALLLPPSSFAIACTAPHLLVCWALAVARHLQGQAEAVGGVPKRATWPRMRCAVKWHSPVKPMARPGLGLAVLSGCVAWPGLAVRFVHEHERDRRRACSPCGVGIGTSRRRRLPVPPCPRRRPLPHGRGAPCQMSKKRAQSAHWSLTEGVFD